MRSNAALNQEMNEVEAKSRKAKYFRWGILLTWIPLLVFMLCVGDLCSPHPSPIVGISRTLLYGLPLLGFGLGFGLEVAAFTLLIRGFSRGDFIHYILFLLSVIGCALMIFIFGIIFGVCLLALMHVQPGLATISAQYS
jgi:hypothetical protein